MRSSDRALRAIADMLPRGWMLHSIQVTGSGDYSVLLCPTGALPKDALGPGGAVPRLLAVGTSVREALDGAATELAHYQAYRASAR